MLCCGRRERAGWLDACRRLASERAGWRHHNQALMPSCLLTSSAVPGNPALQDVPTRVFPVLDYFASIGLDTPAQRRLLVKAPTMLSYSLDRIKVGGWVGGRAGGRVPGLACMH